jgi:hypothetical protein
MTEYDLPAPLSPNLLLQGVSGGAAGLRDYDGHLPRSMARALRCSFIVFQHDVGLIKFHRIKAIICQQGFRDNR